MKSTKFLQSALDLANDDTKSTVVEANSAKGSLLVPPITSLAGMKFIPETYNHCVELLLQLYDEGRYNPRLTYGKWVIFGNLEIPKDIEQVLNPHLVSYLTYHKHRGKPSIIEIETSDFFLPEYVKTELDKIQSSGQKLTPSLSGTEYPAIYTPNIYYRLPKTIQDQLKNYIYKSKIKLSF